MARPVTEVSLGNAAFAVLYEIMKGRVEGKNAEIRLKAAIAVLQAQKKLGMGSRVSPAPEDQPVGEEEEDVPELKGMSNRELRDLIEEK